MIDMQGRITQANQRMSRMFGLPIDELVGNEYVALVPFGARTIARKDARIACQPDSVGRSRPPVLARRSDGVLGRLTGRQLLDANGTKLGLVGVIADIDVRKRAEDRLQSPPASSPMPVKAS